jgi:hypothetical protein
MHYTFGLLIPGRVRDFSLLGFLTASVSATLATLAQALDGFIVTRYTPCRHEQSCV